MCLVQSVKENKSVEFKTSQFLSSTLKFLSGVLCQLEEDEAISQKKKLCEDKSAGELFRLKAGADNCRDVIQCTDGVSLGCFFFNFLTPF